EQRGATRREKAQQVPSGGSDVRGRVTPAPNVNRERLRTGRSCGGGGRGWRAAHRSEGGAGEGPTGRGQGARRRRQAPDRTSAAPLSERRPSRWFFGGAEGVWFQDMVDA